MPDYIILWLGVQEYENFTGTLDEAINHVKFERRYLNYGHRGARILANVPRYQIEMEPKESTF